MPSPTANSPEVDLVITFQATKNTSQSKQQTRQDARKAEEQYERLIRTLTDAGLKAVGRRGESLGYLLVFVKCAPKRVEELVKRERQSDFLSGLPVAPVSSIHRLSPADRIRLVHTFITAMPKEGGLGISPDSPEWDLVQSIFALHDREFNEVWIRDWKPRNIASIQLEKIRDHLGDSLAFYFAFLASYTHFLAFPAALGVAVHFFFPPYSPAYSILLCIWSIAFVEWWRIHERVLSLRFGTRGSFRVEKHRPQYKPGMRWWIRELRVLASVPIILLFAAFLSAILTGIFMLENFVTELYEGPMRQVVTFSPTLLFVLFVPRVLAVYQTVAVKLTNWENHAHKSSYTASLTLKTFALSGIVAYLGLGLTAFLYVPFGEGVMTWLQAWLFNRASTSSGLKATLWDMLNGTVVTVGKDPTVVADSLRGTGKPGSMIWDSDGAHVKTKLHSGRLTDQMFAYTVTGQVMNTLTEVGLPFVLRYAKAFWKSRTKNGSSRATNEGETGPKKRVVFEDEQERGGLEERAFLDRVRQEAALPDYDLFTDYSEMIVQFGYIVLWSTIWPLSGVMSLLNNLLEMRSDAFKMTVHTRRPLPARTDTIGPWLDALTFLTWLGALTNPALIYLFSPHLLSASTPSLFSSGDATAPDSALGDIHGTASRSKLSVTQELLLKAILVSLVASHGFILLRSLIQHIVLKMFWMSCEEVEERQREDREVKKKFLLGSAVDLGSSNIVVEDESEGAPDTMEFWEHDDGVEEIQRISKEA